MIPIVRAGSAVRRYLCCLFFLFFFCFLISKRIENENRFLFNGAAGSIITIYYIFTVQYKQPSESESTGQRLTPKQVEVRMNCTLVVFQ